ncbi:uncharacterized protein K02A2.6-like [Cydia fagiglandana]|uniref:uncharacterized protein K02A2.6-like n=1 Tax=Cydia fagiglandana TaxID=1458189 RepID=UPI002FEE13A1
MTTPSLALEKFDCEGKTNIADSLSRLCKNLDERNSNTKGKDFVQNIVEQIRPVAISLQEIESSSKEDSDIQKVKTGLYDSKWDQQIKSYKILENELCFCGDILLRGSKIVIPKTLREKVLEAAHEGHPGVVGMKARLRAKVWWPRYDKDVERLVKSCKGCTLVSAPNPPNPIKRRELPTHPWVDIAIDLLGPLPSGDYLLVVIDYYSRYKEIKACRDISSKAMIAILKEMFSRLGCPITITADNGKQFVSQEFRDFCQNNDIHLFNTIPYWPQQNGEVERQNRDIIKRLKISQIDKKNWKDSLLEYLTMYNSTPHTTTGKTPAELFFQRKFRDKIPMIDTFEYNYKDQDMDVRDRDREQKEKGKEYANKKRRVEDGNIKVGDEVYVKNMNKTNKLAPNYEPTRHTVVSSKGGDVNIENNETVQRLRRNMMHLKKVEGQWKILDEEMTETNGGESDN